MTARRLLLLLSALFCPPLPAQTEEAAPAPSAAPVHAAPVVYKCVNADGSIVYAQDPCSADPAKVKTIDTAPAMRAGSGGHQGEIAASVADSDCREQALKSSRANEAQIAESNRHIADYERRRQELQAAPAYPVAAPAPAPASDAEAAAAAPAAAAPADNDQALAQLDASIAAEREFQNKAAAGNEAAYQEALRRCDEELRRASQPPPAPAKPAPAASDSDRQ